jgi:hypothetical protein
MKVKQTARSFDIIIFSCRKYSKGCISRNIYRDVNTSSSGTSWHKNQLTLNLISADLQQIYNDATSCTQKILTLLIVSTGWIIRLQYQHQIPLSSTSSVSLNSLCSLTSYVPKIQFYISLIHMHVSAEIMFNIYIFQPLHNTCLLHACYIFCTITCFND